MSLQRLRCDQIYVDPEIYPREQIQRAHVAELASCLRESAAPDSLFDPIEVERVSQEDGAARYRVLDGAHRWQATKEVGLETVAALVVDLNGDDPLLYAASRQTDGLKLSESDARKTARAAYARNPKLTSAQIASRVKRSQRTVNEYLKDLRAAYEMQQDLLILKLDRLGWPQEWIAERIGLSQKTVDNHLVKMAELPKLLNSDLQRGFPVHKVAEKHGWPEPLVWSVALEGKDDLERFEALGWKLRTWDNFSFSGRDRRFGGEWPGNIPAQIVAHTLRFFTRPGDLVLDPMAGGGVTPDTCLAMGRKCWAYDLETREERPEIVTHYWDPAGLTWPRASKFKPDLIFLDPPYYAKKKEGYAEGSISSLPRQDYLHFFNEFFTLLAERSKKDTRLAFLIADWRDFQGKSALEEDPDQAILLHDYTDLLRSAWQITHYVDAPLSSERFTGSMVAAMQERGALGTTSRWLIIARRR